MGVPLTAVYCFTFYLLHNILCISRCKSVWSNTAAGLRCSGVQSIPSCRTNVHGATFWPAARLHAAGTRLHPTRHCSTGLCPAHRRAEWRSYVGDSACDWSDAWTSDDYVGAACTTASCCKSIPSESFAILIVMVTDVKIEKNIVLCCFKMVFTHDSIYAIAHICYGNSVRLSVTRVDGIKTAKHIIDILSPSF